MKITRVDGHVLHAEGGASERAALLHAGMCWEDDEGSMTTRLWLLPAISRMVERVQIAPRALDAIRDLRRWQASPIDHAPRAVDCALPLREYQRPAVGKLLAERGFILADDVGLGKTIEAGTAMYWIIRDEQARGIVVTTNSTKYQWKDELLRLAPGDLRIPLIVAHGEKRVRHDAYRRWERTDDAILIVHHDAFRRDVLELEKHAKKVASQWPLIVCIDEASAIKNPETKLWRAAMRIGQHASYRWALTATPIENRLSDLWGISEFVRPEYLPPFETFKRLHVQEAEFQARRAFKTKRGRWTRPKYTKVVGHMMLPEARMALKPIYMRRTAEEVGEEMPEVVPLWYELKLTARQQALYKAAREKVRRGEMSDLGAYALLSAVCNDPAVLGVDNPGTSPKADLMNQLIATWDTHKVVIFTESKKFAKILQTKLAQWKPLMIHGGIDSRSREHAKNAFQTTDLRVLITTSAGERGLNLQAGSIIIHADLPWNPARIRQRIGRIRRVGSKHKHVRSVFLLMRGTMEAKIVSTVGGKSRLFDAVLRSGDDQLGDVLMMDARRAIQCA